MKRKKAKKFLVVGIDEAGRGPLAGPVTVAAVIAKANSKFEYRNSKQIPKFKFQNSKLLVGIKDSKKLSAKQRSDWEKIIRKNFKCSVATVSPQTIDKIGISRATKQAVNRALHQLSRFNLDNLKPCMVFLDGLLKAPKSYNQKTIIKGDEKVPLISAASIIAKTYRDRKMVRFHKVYPQYDFDKHKGYGTKQHFQKIKKYGISVHHRNSFIHDVDKR
ncbi:ribonuclease HII [Patescibacteria group bacterium]